MFGLRRSFLLDPSVTFLNHGSFGATPKTVFRTYQKWQHELERQPVEFLGRRFSGLMAEARSVLAGYLGTQADNLVYVTNVTVAVNIVARSLRLGPGDEILSTDHEYGACDRTWRFLARKQGFTYINQSIPVPVSTPERFVESLWRGVSRRTRLIFLSHITSPTALIFPVEEVCRRARAEGILTLVDGAHTPGQVPLYLDGLGADFYGANLHKWLCAPKGSGFLYARPEVQELVEPLVVSWGWEAEMPGPSKFVDHHEWWGTRDLAAFLSVPEAIKFQKEHEWDKVRAACHDLAREAQERICDLAGLASIYPSIVVNEHGVTQWEWFAQMSAAPLPESVDLNQLKARLYEEYHIEIPLILWNGRKLIRVSVQGYNTRGDILRLLAALEMLIQKPGE